MKIKHTFFVTFLCLALTSCVSGINPDGLTPSVQAPVITDISTVLIAANPTGYCMNPGDTTWSATMPDCTWENVDAADRVYEVAGLPAWLAFDEATLIISLASGITEIPAYTASIDVTYTCASAPDPTVTDFIVFDIVDCDAGGALDIDEIDNSKPPISDNTIGYIPLDDFNVDIYNPLDKRPWPEPLITDGLDLTLETDDTTDLDGDGFSNLAEITNNTNLFVWTAAMNLAATSTSNNTDPMRAIAYGDFNNDLFNDIIVGNTTGRIQVHLNNGVGGFNPQAPINFGGTQPVVDIAIGDVNSDGNMDAVVVINLDFDFAVLLGDGTGVFTLLQYVNLAGVRGVTLGDFDGNQLLDIAIIDETQARIYRFDTVAGQFVFDNMLGVGGTPVDIATADVNNDNILDLIVVDDFADEMGIYLGQGDRTFALSNTYAIGNHPNYLTLADFDNDGFIDVAVSVDANVIGIFLNNGDGTYAAGSNVAVSSNMGFITAGDLNGNKLPDVVMLDILNDILIVGVNNGNMTFSETPYVLRGVQGWGIAVFDIDNNNALDIAATDLTPVAPWVFVYTQ